MLMWASSVCIIFYAVAGFFFYPPPDVNEFLICNKVLYSLVKLGVLNSCGWWKANTNHGVKFFIEHLLWRKLW
jgi:hypothetical protein